MNMGTLKLGTYTKHGVLQRRNGGLPLEKICQTLKRPGPRGLVPMPWARLPGLLGQWSPMKSSWDRHPMLGAASPSAHPCP